MTTIYADNAATTQMSRAAIDAMLPYLETIYGNPSSLHSVGQQAAGALLSARDRIAKCLNAFPREIYFTRAEFAAIAARFDHDGDKTAAKFSDIANHWAKDEISIAYNNGWITGYPDGTFGPQRDITRAETMTLVNRVLNRQPETEDDLLPNMTVWTDNANPNAWYYLAVQEATNSHYYKFKTNSKYEKWTELRETRDWTQLEK